MDEAFAHIEGNENKSKKGIPPDGGWGYVVGLGVGFTFVSTYLPVISSSLVLFWSPCVGQLSNGIVKGLNGLLPHGSK